MLKQIRPALVMIVLMTALTGLAYPYAVFGIAQAVFPAQANGSLIERDGRVIGSELIGQSFTSDRYFNSRPSATSPDPYNAAASGASNAAPTAKALVERVGQGVTAYREAFGQTGAVPADAVTTTGSGLDPHISPDNAEAQIARVAAARNLPQERVRELVGAATEDRTLGFLGEPRVNVLLLNLSLDREDGGRGNGSVATQ